MLSYDTTSYRVNSHGKCSTKHKDNFTSIFMQTVQKHEQTDRHGNANKCISATSLKMLLKYPVS